MNLNLHLLNPQQRAAVEHIHGPLLILAGAGSGKTRVVTHRIGYLIQRGVDPSDILAVSFTNKAAGEMRERVAGLTGKEIATKVYLSTFHSLGADILRHDIDKLGYKKPFTILDSGDQLSIIKDAMKELKLDPKVVEPRRLLALISRAKMGFCTPEELEELRHDPILPFAQRAYAIYHSALKGLNAIDFDDMICLPVKIFQADPATRQRWAERFYFVMVDEYQDTNQTQLLFLDELVRDHKNICVVGDDDQSIYGFRGAVAENILEFEHRFRNTKVIKLEQNYRSTNNILRAANDLIAHNKIRKEKALWSAQGDGDVLHYVQCADDREEAEYVSAEIERLKLNMGIEYDDFAILYRANSQARPFEEALRAYRIPYTLVGGTEFFDRKEVKDFVAYIKACLNPNDEINLRRIVNVPPRGIGPTLLERISEYAHEKESSFFEALSLISEDHDLIHGIGPSAGQRLKELVETLNTFRKRFYAAEDDEEGSISEIARAFLKRISLIEHLKSTEKNPKIARIRVNNVEDVLSSIASFEEKDGNNLRAYITRISLDRSYESDDEEDKRGVKMLTLHSSKGLEFPVVFFVGMEEGLLPHERSQDEAGIAEERRLAYVGITRAKEVLYLTGSAERTRYGKKEEREPSRFLDEIPAEMIEIVRAGRSESLKEQRDTQNQKYLAALRAVIFDK